MRSKHAGRRLSIAADPRPISRFTLCVTAVLAVAVALAAAPSALAYGVRPSWPTASQSILGERWQPFEFQISPQDVGHLARKWVFTTHGDVADTPTVANGVVYFTDFGGYLNAVNARTGSLIWQRQIVSYAGEPQDRAGVTNVSRVSPLVIGNELVLGDNTSIAQPDGARVFAVNRSNGSLIWSTEVDDNPAAVITSNPVNYGNEIVVGVSSNEEGDAHLASYHCCSFRGAVVALDARTGKLVWKTYTVPSNNPAGGDSNIPCATSDPARGCGYTGGAVWGTPTVDPFTNQVFVGTGNNYTTPDAATACANADENATPPIDDADCTVANDYFDSVVALNLQNGKLEWGHKVQGYDAWNLACATGEAPGATWCPSPASPDFDFGGSSPNLVEVWVHRVGPRRSSATGKRAASTGCSTSPTGTSSGTRWLARARRSGGSSGAAPTMACGSTPRRPTPTRRAGRATPTTCSVAGRPPVVRGQR